MRIFKYFLRLIMTFQNSLKDLVNLKVLVFLLNLFKIRFDSPSLVYNFRDTFITCIGFLEILEEPSKTWLRLAETLPFLKRFQFLSSNIDSYQPSVN